jgi:hypothetical protein
VVIQDHRQPRPRRPARVIENEHVEQRVIGLPHVVRRVRLTAVDELVAIPVTLGAVVRERQQPRIETSDDVVDGAVARRRPVLSLRHGKHLPMDERHRRPRPPQREALNELDQLSPEPPTAAITTTAAREPRQPVGAVALQPPPRRAQRHPGRPGGSAQRHAALHVRPQHAPALHRLLAQVLVQLGQ